MKSAKCQKECHTCIMFSPHKCSCYALIDNANDKNGRCKFYKSINEYTLKYNEYVEGYVPERITDEN